MIIIIKKNSGDDNLFNSPTRKGAEDSSQKSSGIFHFFNPNLLSFCQLQDNHICAWFVALALVTRIRAIALAPFSINNKYRVIKFTRIGHNSPSESIKPIGWSCEYPRVGSIGRSDIGYDAIKYNSFIGLCCVQSFCQLCSEGNNLWNGKWWFI